MTGKEKSARIDLGLALLSARSRPNACWTYREIAAWCGCTDAGIQRIETQALRKVRKLLTLSGDELAVEALEHLRRRQGSAGYPEAKWPEQTTYE